MLRQDRLRTLELATLAAAGQESQPSDATVRKLDTFARYGARIDKDMAKALQALRNLRGRPDAWIDDVRNDTSEPAAMAAPRRTREPCLVDLWQGEGAPPLCRGVARGVGDRREPRVRARGSARSRPAFF
jgi:hypothetical protein